MTLYPCPRCGKVPTVTYQDTPSGPEWLADCECFGVYGSDESSLAYSWALYCLEMQEEMS